MGPIRVVLADDAVLLREALASALTAAGFDVVGQADDLDSLLGLVARERPDVVVADVRMPPTHTTEGLEAARRIRAEHPEIAILVLMAEGRSNQAIAQRLGLETKTVEGHVGAIFGKLGLEPATTDHRRVLAVLAFLREG